jgi:hypothetical protein
MDNDRNADSAKDFAGKVEGSVGSMAGTHAAGAGREAAETLRHGSRAVAEKVGDYFARRSAGRRRRRLCAGDADGGPPRRPPQRWRDYWDR